MFPVPSPSSIEPILQQDDGGRPCEVFPLPVDEAVLDALIVDLFENHWDKIVFGPIIQGAAYEIRAAAKPHKIGLLDGYLTIHFGPSHVHLCIGDNFGVPSHPTPDALRRHRRTARAEFFRSLDDSGCPVTWGLRLFNGAGEQQMTVFLPNPFLAADDTLLATPDWSRLALWEEINRRYLNREPDGRDRTGTGFSHG
ncbi:MAG: hypothetical protein H6843_05800 [Rhodospirillaceae bacterium]|nr:hypothetical protein [Rhodospirillaceae bacterium]